VSTDWLTWLDTLFSILIQNNRDRDRKKFDGQRVLLGGKSEVPGEEKDGRVRGDRKAETR
jgi:hypothetical protein